MTAKIKLNSASGGGSFSLQAPSSSANNRVFTLPDVADGTITTTATSSNIVQGTSTTQNDFTTTSFVASSLSATITPKAASSKILIQSSFLIDTINNDRQIYVALFRSINGGTFTNLSGGSNTAAIATYGGGARIIEKGSVIRLDTPSYSVGNSIVYKLYCKTTLAGATVRITGQGVEDVMILQEVAA